MSTVKEILGAELYAQVTDKLGDKNLIIDDGKLIPKHRFDCINISLKEHKQLVAELRKKADAYDAAKRDLDKLTIELHVLTQIMRWRPKNCIAVRANINVGTLIGKKLEREVNKQLAELKTTDPYLFIDDTECLYRLVPVRGSDLSEK